MWSERSLRTRQSALKRRSARGGGCGPRSDGHLWSLAPTPSPTARPSRPLRSDTEWAVTFRDESSDDEPSSRLTVRLPEPSPPKKEPPPPKRPVAAVEQKKLARKAFDPFNFNAPTPPAVPKRAYWREEGASPAPVVELSSKTPVISLPLAVIPLSSSTYDASNRYHADAIEALVEELLERKMIRRQSSMPKCYEPCPVYLRRWCMDAMEPWRLVKGERRSLAINLTHVNQHLRYPSTVEYASQERWKALLSSKFFSKIRLRSGYLRLRLDSADRVHTAFTTESGTYEWRVAPYGLVTVPAYFHLGMKMMFEDEPDVFFTSSNVYVHGRTKAERDEAVARVRRTLFPKGTAGEDASRAQTSGSRNRTIPIVSDCHSALYIRGVKVENGAVTALPFRTEALRTLGRLDDPLRQQAFSELLRRGLEPSVDVDEIVRILENVDRGDSLLSAVYNARSMVSRAVQQQAVPSPGLFALYVDFGSEGFGAYLAVEPIARRSAATACSSAEGDSVPRPILRPVAFLANVFDKRQLQAPLEVRLYLTIRESLQILQPIIDTRKVELRCCYVVEDVVADCLQRRMWMHCAAVLAERNVHCKYVSPASNVVARALARVFSKSRWFQTDRWSGPTTEARRSRRNAPFRNDEASLRARGAASKRGGIREGKEDSSRFGPWQGRAPSRVGADPIRFGRKR